MIIYGIEKCKNKTEQSVASALSNINPSRMKHKVDFAVANLNIPQTDSPDRECDFLIVGSSGIVVLEVKGGSNYEVKDGMWYTYNAELKKHRSDEDPFTQSQNNYYAIQEILTKKLKVKKAGYFAVVFPDQELNKPLDNNYPMEIHLDSRFLSHPESFIDTIYDYSIKKFGKKTLSVDEIEKIKSHFVPNYSDYISDLTNADDKRVLMLSEEQKLVLDGLGSVKRMVIDGPAGSGKTVLAIEQLIINEKNYIETAYVCFNRAIKNKVASELTKRLGREPLYIDLHTTTSLAINNASKKYEFLVADEAQDYLRDENFEPIFSHVIGNISKGKYRIFLDFDQEVFTGSCDIDFYNELVNERDDVVPYHLKKNYRNTYFIAAMASGITRIYPGEHENNPVGTPPKIEMIPYTDRFNVDWDTYAKNISLAINNLLKDRYQPSDIMIIVNKKLSQSILSDKNIEKIKIKNGVKLVHAKKYDWFDDSNKSILYGSVYETKGLDSKVALILDLFDSDKNNESYVAITRARTKAILFMGEAYKRAQATDVQDLIGMFIKYSE